MSDLARPPIEPIERSVALRFFSEAQLERLRAATLCVLEEVGVRVDSALARDILHGHGAVVDAATRVVRLPADVVEKAMARAPRSFVLGARDPSCELDLAREATFCTTDGCATELIDWQTGERRLSTKADLEAITRLQDYLPGIAFWWPTVAAGDRGRTAQLHEIEAGWGNTVKHVQGFVQGGSAAEYAVQMATAVAGGPEKLRRRPVLSNLIATVSPLCLDRDAMDAALVFAAAGVPVCFVTMPARGSTAPATSAGAMAVGAAELVSATVLLQLASPGAPVLHSIIPSHIDPRSGSFLNFPLDARGRSLPTEVVHSWGVPSESASCGTDATRTGTWQGGVEMASDLALAALEGSELLTSIGLLESYQVFAAEEMILGSDLLQRARYAVMDVPVDDDELALDVVADVGPGGHFLGHRHTRAHLREATRLAITHAPAEGGGYRDPVEVAREEALRLLDRYRPEPLPATLADELATILAAADAELRGD
jgi:trimethylamine--corrinoid protein Co-methyltransferase